MVWRGRKKPLAGTNQPDGRKVCNRVESSVRKSRMSFLISWPVFIIFKDGQPAKGNLAMGRNKEVGRIR